MIKDGMKAIFDFIDKTELWKSTDNDSTSGPGSNEEKTKDIVGFLNTFCKGHDIDTIFNVGAGRSRWDIKIDSKINVLRADILDNIPPSEPTATELTPFNTNEIPLDYPNFDITDFDSCNHIVSFESDYKWHKFEPGENYAILLRDVFVHLSYDSIIAGLSNILFFFKQAKYLILTNFDNHTNKDIKDGSWRPLDFTKPPFNLPPPYLVKSENEQYPYSDKTLSVWDLTELRQLANFNNGIMLRKPVDFDYEQELIKVYQPNFNNLDFSKEAVMQNHSKVVDKVIDKKNVVTVPRSINLGCADNILPNCHNVDLFQYKGVNEIVDLTKKFPYPDNYFDTIYAHDIIEHLPDKIHTMNEIYRIASSKSRISIIVPSSNGTGAFQDPTHVSYWNERSFQYFDFNSAYFRRFHGAYGIKGGFKILELNIVDTIDGPSIKVIMQPVKF